MKTKKYLLSFMLVFILMLTACGKTEIQTNVDSAETQVSNIENDAINIESEISSESNDTTEVVQESTENDIISLDNIPDYNGMPYIEINNNIPFFSEDDKQRTDAFEYYSELDALGRCGVAYANICKELQPTEERCSIGQIKPSGWHTMKYNGYIEGNYLYNRCHLIGYQLAGENANEKNLITGTRYMNCDGQLPFEDMVDDYVDETGNHVLYRVTPIYGDNNFVAYGVLTEAYSVEDSGKGLQFCVYCYNVQPGIGIDYATGDSWLIDGYEGEYSTKTYFNTKKVKTYTVGGNSIPIQEKEPDDISIETEKQQMKDENETNIVYVLNTNTMKFHLSNCRYAESISEVNREETTKSRDELLSEGYEACKVCNP